MSITSTRSATLGVVVGYAVMLMASTWSTLSFAHPGTVLILRMSVDHGVHSVIEAQIVESATPLQLSPSTVQADTLNFAVTDSAGKVLVEGGMPDPRILRGPMPLPDEAPGGHRIVRLDTTEYFLRLPYSPTMRYLKLAENTKPALTPPANKASSSASASSESTVTIDLSKIVGSN